MLTTYKESVPLATGLIISVLDIKLSFERRFWPDYILSYGIGGKRADACNTRGVISMLPGFGDEMEGGVGVWACGIFAHLSETQCERCFITIFCEAVV